MYENFLIRRRDRNYKSTRVTPEIMALLERAEALLKRTLKAGLKPDWFICESVINMLSEFGLSSHAERVLSLLQDQGVEGITASGLLQAHLREGKHAAAEKDIERINTNSPEGRATAHLAYLSFVMAACKRKHWDSAASYIAKMPRDAQAKAHAYLLHAMAKAGDMKRAEKLLAELEKQPETLDALPYLSIIVYTIRRADLAGARKWVDRMKERMSGMPQLSYMPIMQNLQALANAKTTAAAARDEALAWYKELEAVPEAERAPPLLPGQRNATPPELVDEIRNNLDSVRAAMPESLRKWMEKPTGSLSAEHRAFLSTAASEAFSGMDRQQAIQAVAQMLVHRKSKAKEEQARASAA